MIQNASQSTAAAATVPPVDLPVTAQIVLDVLAAQGREPDDQLVKQVVDAAANMQRVLARLRSAGDTVLDAVRKMPEMPGEQIAAAESVVARVIEHTEALMLVRQSVTALVLPADDAEVAALIATSDALADAVFAAVAA
ncbi:hypothetical protein [Cupriavidus pampae]|jgi:hypothetical protein|uniref:Uncharacterized protein n=1 Tax=Cupriavidus pampae TaxID=659251 RepID=A0ABM8XUS3_9BURK|nr:hypothetical protein [Cupriavidus pampae]CAG9184136.1 hypothetical protein LMG32289_05528 [Cupriavidus pampae]